MQAIVSYVFKNYDNLLNSLFRIKVRSRSKIIICTLKSITRLCCAYVTVRFI